MQYTHPKIKGTPHTHMLPPNTALILEGGGTRGFFSAGVFEAFMDEGLMFPYIASVSAGSANAFSYISGQKGRGRFIIENYVGDKRYLSYRNMLRLGSLFGYDFIFKTIPTKHVYWDKEVFDSTETRFLVGALNCATGGTHWFEKHEISEGLEELIASCSVPLLSKIVQHKGMELLDGGVNDPIPIEKSIADGNTFHVVVLTRNQGYQSKPFRFAWLARFFYRKHPRLAEAIMTRHNAYNRQLALCEELEQEGKAVIIRPQRKVEVGRATSDIAKILTLHDEGHHVGRNAIEKIKGQFS